MKEKRKFCISSASAKLSSMIYATTVTPKNVQTVGIKGSVAAMRQLAAQIMAVCECQNANLDDVVILTGRPENSSVTVLRNYKIPQIVPSAPSLET